ncbi:MAG: lipid-A-disaccharide synthase N-terminal domain-containing protein [Alphaproteobacteria bacterium]|nr:lipid-A-disaccharide synthase N-terminal domain-containing protein [Alphaproteobacteria bacterium]MBP7759957.1 lipid-A-disaccharide synthase N-terminal domain-containing protein [Alphaproteobacteria bacterium]MBP7763311.1 lipid-A-disaccharide synthase N-terminal domain-containing protein [Alphaproteobacteria bacterium]MBP7905367.1 lipid-A-disaccharide synthase N-terminal domain-containing protein [Alphaproteobacteria bacterium]
MSAEAIWLSIGFIGQFLFFMRFFVQWIASERAKKSVIPNAFWYFSLSGGLVLTIYALYRQDPVFILGQGLGILIYTRNLYFLHASKTNAEA